jgi:hypothetical protein
MKRMTAAVVLGLALLVGPDAQAQLGLSVRASSLGAGGELSYRANRYVGLRVGGNYLRLSRSATIEGIEYDLTPQLKNGSGVVDLHPLGSSFHLSGGVLWNSNRGDVVAQLTGPITIGNATYQPSEVGALTGRLSYSRKYAPYAGIGFGGQSRVAFLFDVGLVFSGYPTATLTSSSNLTGQAKVVFDQNVAQEIQEIQAEIEGKSFLKYYPVVSLGLRVRI